MPSRPSSLGDLASLSLSYLAWFEGDEAGEGTGLGCNLKYRDLRGVTLEEVRQVIALESEQVESALSCNWRCDGYVDGCETCDFEIEGLEIGVVSAVAALSAIACIPYTSCNGGVFGGSHAADLLIVGFYLRPAHVETVQKAAGRAGVGLTNDRCGGVFVITDDPRAMIHFATAFGRLDS